MLKQDPKTRCDKKTLPKATDVCRCFSRLQSVYADMLQSNEQVESITCNMLLADLDIGAYTSDFVCKMIDGSLMVRECVERRYLTKPMTVGLLEASRDYWLRRGVSDWGIVTDREINNAEH